MDLVFFFFLLFFIIKDILWVKDNYSFIRYVPGEWVFLYCNIKNPILNITA